jgi:catechol-2,3-dioxygenase
MPSTGCRIVGLHHVASLVNSRDKLQDVYARAQQNDKVQIEFAPELLRQGPAQHMMCLEPSGIRVEFIWPGN